MFTGRREDPAWARPGLWILLLLAAATYLWRLTSSGYANDFYAASVKSATQSWRAWLWASLDSQLSVTVDKPPASIWIMGLSGRILGFSSFSMLLPQALMGVATVGLTYGAVHRLSGHGAGLLAGLLVTLTPVAALMFKFDNPDAMLVACVVAAAYMIVRALTTGRDRYAAWWMIGAGWLLGLAFLTKMLQGLLVLPALALAYLLCARRGWWTRIRHLLAATGSLVASAGWLIALCAIWPASSRPYIGGSTNNSLWQLAIGYNGLSRILGHEASGGDADHGMRAGADAVAGGGFGGGFGGRPGLARLFDAPVGTEIGWLLPAALILLVGGLIACGRRPLSDRRRAGLILWGGSMLMTAAVFSFMSGLVHPYYTVALAPLVAGTIASGVTALRPHPGQKPATALLERVCPAIAIVGTGAWGFHLMASSAPAWDPWIRWVALIGSLVGAVAYVIAAVTPSGGAVILRRIVAGALVVGGLSAVAPTAAWTAATTATGHEGGNPTSGPAGTSSATGLRRRTTAPARGSAGSDHSRWGLAGSGRDGTVRGEQVAVSPALATLLDDAGTTWSAATIGDQSAAPYILATRTAVFSIGGWSGSDPNITLAKFQRDVRTGRIHYFIPGTSGSFGAPGATGDRGWAGRASGSRGAFDHARSTRGAGLGGASKLGSSITRWVSGHYAKETVGGVTVYDLAIPIHSAAR